MRTGRAQTPQSFLVLFSKRTAFFHLGVGQFQRRSVSDAGALRFSVPADRAELGARANGLCMPATDHACQHNGTQGHGEDHDRRRLGDGSAAARTARRAAARATRRPAARAAGRPAAACRRDALGSAAVENGSASRALDRWATWAAAEADAAATKHAATHQTGAAESSEGGQLARPEASAADTRTRRVQSAPTGRPRAAVWINRCTRVHRHDRVRAWPDATNNSVDVVVVNPTARSGGDTRGRVARIIGHWTDSPDTQDIPAPIYTMRQPLTNSKPSCKPKISP